MKERKKKLKRKITQPENLSWLSHKIKNFKNIKQNIFSNYQHGLGKKV